MLALAFPMARCSYRFPSFVGLFLPLVMTSFHSIRVNTVTEKELLSEHPQKSRTDPQTYFHFLLAWVVGNFLTTRRKKTMRNELFFQCNCEQMYNSPGSGMF